MVDPQTANLQLFTPVNGADPGAWDVPVNANWNQLEAVLTAAPSIALSNLPITLSAAQYNASFITFTGTLTGNVTVTFPAFARPWHLFNNCLSAASFAIICKTAASTVYVALPPGEVIKVISDGTNIRYMDLGRVGEYSDIGSSSVPVWITNAVPQPYLNCDGTSFSSATYPNLRDYLGNNVLPDSKGRFRGTLDQGAGRLTGASSTNGLDGTTLLAGGGNQLFNLTNLPNFSSLVTVPVGGSLVYGAAGPANAPAFAPPSYTGGLTLIRAG